MKHVDFSSACGAYYLHATQMFTDELFRMTPVSHNDWQIYKAKLGFLSSRIQRVHSMTLKVISELISLKIFSRATSQRSRFTGTRFHLFQSALKILWIEVFFQPFSRYSSLFKIWISNSLAIHHMLTFTDAQLQMVRCSVLFWNRF